MNKKMPKYKRKTTKIIKRKFVNYYRKEIISLQICNNI